MSWVAIGVTVVGTALSAGLSYASQPEYPDQASASRELSNLNAALLPLRRQLESAAQQGTRLVTNVPVFNGSTWVMQPQVFDFTGLGAADAQAKVAEQMAKLQLDMAQKYDHQFIAEALKQAELADPEGFAARRKMDELIQEQIQANPDRPVAELLDKQIMEQLVSARGGKLDPEMKGVLDEAVADALSARGGQSAPGADFEEPLTTGFAGEQRQREAAQRAMGWLTSGATPEDIGYRREQQNLANLSALTTGQTPLTQFQSLSGAQQGPTPITMGQQLSGMPQGQQAQAASIANAQSQNVDSWLAGVTGALNLGSAAISARR